MENSSNEIKVPTWIKEFISSEYFPFDNPMNGEQFKNQCPCQDKKPCTKFFCIPCKTGHLCKKLHFKPQGEHEGHANLQVRKVTHRNAIAVKDIETYCKIPKIQKFDCNSQKCYFLHSKALPDLRREVEMGHRKIGNNRHCKICNASIRTEDDNEEAVYCSLQCGLSVWDGFEEFKLKDMPISNVGFKKTNGLKINKSSMFIDKKHTQNHFYTFKGDASKLKNKVIDDELVMDDNLAATILIRLRNDKHKIKDIKALHKPIDIDRKKLNLKLLKIEIAL